MHDHVETRQVGEDLGGDGLALRDEHRSVVKADDLLELLADCVLGNRILPLVDSLYWRRSSLWI